MIGSIVENGFHTNYRISCKWALLYRFLDTFFNCREVVLRNCASHYLLFKYIRCLQITRRLKSHLYMSILSMSTGLILIFILYIRFLAKGLTESYLRFGQFHIHFIFFSQHADDHCQMLISHTIE